MYLGERLGVNRSTKFHPELAVEGIEYSWGRAKSVNRSAKLTEKRGKKTSLFFSNVFSMYIVGASQKSYKRT
jgi:hypothetical protein